MFEILSFFDENIYGDIILRSMKINKSNFNSDVHQQSKFLARSQSSTDLPFFCCSAPIHHSSETSLPFSKHHHTPKVSVKELMKKSSIQFNKSQSYNQELFGHSRGNSSRLYAHSRQQSGDSSNFQSINSGQKIQFSYRPQKEQSEKVQNYNTTNYIVDKYIVQPQQVNIIFPKKQCFDTQMPKDRFFDLSNEFQQEQTMRKNHGSSNNCHFSFGKNQKQYLMSKLAVKEVESRRQSRNSKESGFRGSYEEKQEVIGDGQVSFDRGFQRKSLFEFATDNINAIASQDDQDNSDGNSQVIQDYKSIMGRMAKGQQF